MIIFGRRASNIGNFDTSSVKCQFCEELCSHRVSVFGKYAHIFWIPIFPIGKKAVAECTNCDKTIEQKEFSPELKQLYKDNKSLAKRPFWHWLGLGVLAILIALISILIRTAEEDPRSDLYRSDKKTMTSNPTMDSDSISYKIKQVFDNFATAEINPYEFEYLTKIQGNKALILVKIPKFRKVEKEARGEALEMIKLVTDEQKDLKGKDKYIGVQGVVTMMLINTPTYDQNSKLALTSELYEFYGPKSPK